MYAKIQVDHWLSFSERRINCSNEFDIALQYLDEMLTTRNVLVGYDVTIADYAVWGSLRSKSQYFRSHCSDEFPTLYMYFAILC